MPKAIEELTALIAELPGLGPRQARRIVQYLLRAQPSYKKKLIERIEALSEHIAQCTRCYRYDEMAQNKLCSLCTNENRDATTLMVVEKDVDVEGVEASGIYKGQYFVLGTLMPLTETRKTAQAPRTTLLKERATEKGLREIILAFATTPEGDYTARELKTELETAARGANITILGRGLSLGAEIEYADRETLRNALQNRRAEF
jgi:recombination protein RecR